MRNSGYYMVNGITVYRLIAAPVLLFLVLNGWIGVFKWLLAFSFFTDAIDGYLARKYNVVSVMGAKLDSLADDMTVLVAIIALLVWESAFLLEEYVWVLSLLVLFLAQLAFALVKYGKITSFHTYLAKGAAVLQGAFLVLSFFLPSPPRLLFHIAVTVTVLQLIEEIAMIFLLRKWQADVKGLRAALRRKKEVQKE